MADFNQQQDNFNFYQGNYGQQQQPPNQGGYYNPQDYPMGAGSGGISMGDPSDFPQEPQFQQFDYSQGPQEYPGGADPQYMTSTPYPAGGNTYTGSILTPDPVQPYNTDPGADEFENEPPLLEELGINFDHIKQKTVAVLNPMVEPDHTIMLDTDLAGPLVFCFIFGGCLLMAGKVHFGYIYGIGVVGCIAMYALLNLMSMTGVTVSIIVSVLGYCLLPMCLLSSVGIILSLQGLVGIVLTAVTVLWCSISASKLFVNALSMDHQQLLVAYPCALVYGVFALIAVF